MRSFLSSESGTIYGPIPTDLGTKLETVFPGVKRVPDTVVDIYNYGPFVNGFVTNLATEETGDEIVLNYSWTYDDPAQVEKDAKLIL